MNDSGVVVAGCVDDTGDGLLIGVWGSFAADGVGGSARRSGNCLQIVFATSCGDNCFVAREVG